VSYLIAKCLEADSVCATRFVFTAGLLVIERELQPIKALAADLDELALATFQQLLSKFRRAISEIFSITTGATSSR